MKIKIILKSPEGNSIAYLNDCGALSALPIIAKFRIKSDFIN